MGTSFECAKVAAQSGEVLRLQVSNSVGVHVIVFKATADALEQLQITVSLTPAVPLLIPFAPRDLYPLGKDDDLLKVGKPTSEGFMPG